MVLYEEKLVHATSPQPHIFFADHPKGVPLLQFLFVNLSVTASALSCLGIVFFLTFACLFVVRFYGPINPMGSCRVQSVYLTTLTGQA